MPIVSFIPMFMFAILFGLSMDYEVFLLSRVREEYVRPATTRTAVVDGIVETARVITSAALIMISVFLGFVLGEDPATKMFGLGLATAIFVDATVVRMVLVPATMTLLGRRQLVAARMARPRAPAGGRRRRPRGRSPRRRRRPAAPGAGDHPGRALTMTSVVRATRWGTQEATGP